MPAKKGGDGGKGGGDGESNQKQPPAAAPQREWTNELQQDYDRIVSVGEECISESELKKLLLMKGRGSDNANGFNLYDGFEPSGRMHIAQGVFKAMNVNKCTFDGNNGATFVFWVADWFALMNDKMRGDLTKIQTVGNYLIEVWKAAGMNLDNVVFKWASEEITTHADVYWPLMLDVARRFNITRIKKCCQIMGRLEGSLTSAQVLYPLMQCTDVFFLKADICQLGVDQRKVNMLAREYCDFDKKRHKHKPIILSHHMLYGLKAGQEKMSKSDPDSAIFMEDSREDVERKILQAYCPSEEPKADADAGAATTTNTTSSNDAGKESMQIKEDKLKNPCLDYVQHIIFSPPNATFTAPGSNKTYTNFDDVKYDFLTSKQLSEEQLKHGLIHSLNELLDPVRDHFTNNDRARELLELVQTYKKESLVGTQTEKVIRRLNLVELNKVPKDCHLVLAPLPTANPTLQEACDLLEQLRLGNNRPCVLYCSDWSARVCNACNADVKAISAYYTVLLQALKTLDPDLMENHVQVLMQGDAILMDPSNYWISVINVGRHFMLDEVMGPQMKDSDGVGYVISRLMRVADVAGIEPKSLALPATGEVSVLEQTLITKFFQAKLDGMTVPNICLKSCKPIRLQQERELEALKTDNDEYFLLDDPKVHGKSKMKKAFCEPGNVAFNPPIAIAEVFCMGPPTTNGCLAVKRPAGNGGDCEYTNVTDLEKDFQSGSLHPGDLKAATSAAMVSILEKLTSGIKANPDAMKASKDLKAFQKKMNKMKK